MLKSLIAAAALFVLPGVALAQESSTSTASVVAGTPAICFANAEKPAEPSTRIHDMGMDSAHMDLLDEMDRMHAEMMAAGSVPDIDIAFVCAMIPHHRGAIDMAKAALVHGDDPWVKELAQSVIDAQEKELAEMIAWLEQQP